MNRRTAIKISFQHVVYAGLLGNLSSAIMACTRNEATEGIAILKILDPTRAAILSIIADQMLPASDTPGALDVGVIPVIDQYLERFLSPENQQTILGGLDRVNQLSQQLFQQPLTGLDANQQMTIMDYLSKDANQSADKSKHLFFLLREMVVKAYFQSEMVAKNVLKYDPIPKVYKGCIPLKEVGGQWAI